MFWIFQGYTGKLSNLQSLSFAYIGGQWQIRGHQIASGKLENIRT